MKWLSDLPEADARRQSFFQEAIRGIAYDPQAADQLARLGAREREAARSVIAAMELPEDRQALLLGALQAR